MHTAVHKRTRPHHLRERSMSVYTEHVLRTAHLVASIHFSAVQVFVTTYKETSHFRPGGRCALKAAGAHTYCYCWSAVRSDEAGAGLPPGSSGARTLCRPHLPYTACSLCQHADKPVRTRAVDIQHLQQSCCKQQSCQQTAFPEDASCIQQTAHLRLLRGIQLSRHG